MRALLSSILTLAVMVPGWVTAQKAEDHFAHLPEGGRRSLHGMVLFGAGPYFLEHIPMLTAPHDFQIIAEVQLTGENGEALTFDFSKSGFTFKPATNFSLNDYVAGRLRSFAGSIHKGSFEQGGPVVDGLHKVNVVVKEYKKIRSLPATSQEQVIRVSDGTNTFESNVIRPQQSIQKIRNVTTGVELWCVKGPDFFEPCQ